MESIEFNATRIEPASWQEHRQLLLSIREPVFVEEQQVPVEIEIDQQDPVSQHWLVFSAEGQAIATARLEPSGKVGRMAVLKNHRGLGVGSSLLRRIILDASSSGHSKLYLHAQSHAIDFYKQFDFLPYGDEFDEAGISHVAMNLDLGRYRQRGNSGTVQTTFIENSTALESSLRKAISEARQTIRWYCQPFNHDILASAQIVESLRHFLQQSDRCELHLLVQDIDANNHSQDMLLGLQRAIDSRFQIRQCDSQDSTPDSALLVIVDDSQLLRTSVGTSTLHGVQRKNAYAEARQHTERFEQLWQRSVVPAELRRLSISG
ncbi:GNAT family N-acetyltransferase [bacterium SCSIO 12696]|nr:GNAT family N-acetyltransferase [bacterium SCSIO 12696]